MNDTSTEFDRLVMAHYAAMTPLQRIEIAMSMRRTAVAIIESSLPPGLSREDRRYETAKRLYGDELPEAALRRHAQYPDPGSNIPDA